MTDEEIRRSAVAFPNQISARGRDGSVRALKTVGDAARYMEEMNIRVPERGALDISHAVKLLRVAAGSESVEHAKSAERAFREFLAAENLLSG